MLKYIKLSIICSIFFNNSYTKTLGEQNKSTMLTINRIYEKNCKTGELLAKFGYHQIPIKKIKPNLWLSKIIPITYFMVRKTNRNYYYDMHNAPKIQYIYNLDAGLNVYVGTKDEINNNIRHKIINSGEIFLVEDTNGLGHKSTAINCKPRTSIFIPISQEIQPQKNDDKSSSYNMDNYQDYLANKDNYEEIIIGKDNDLLPDILNKKLIDRGEIGAISKPIACDGFVIGKNKTKVFLIFLIKK